MNFISAFEFLIGDEGSFQCDPNDRGNWTTGIIGQGKCKGTKFGISAYAYPLLDIQNLTLEQAQTIYQRDYWIPLHADELPSYIRLVLFSFAINTSMPGNPVTAKKTLQRALGVAVDGIIGPKTISAANSEVNIENLLAAEIIEYYINAREWHSFGIGWMRRLASDLRHS